MLRFRELWNTFLKMFGREKTIRSETNKAFFLVFVILSVLAVFTIVSSLVGSRTFDSMKNLYIQQFQSAHSMNQQAADIVGIFYLVAGNSDIEIQMEQLKRYDGLVVDFEKSRIKFEDLVKQSSSDSELLSEVKKVEEAFADMNTTSREMTVAALQGQADYARDRFKLLNVKIIEFRKYLDILSDHVDKDLAKEVNRAQILMKSTIVAGAVIAGLAVIISLFLIYRLMQFLSVSLLPISNLMHNMRQSVFSVDNTFKILNPVSHYSETVFGRNIAGCQLLDVVFSDLDPKTPEYSLLKTSLLSSFGADEVQWMLIEDGLPTKIRKKVGNREKFLDITYTPLWNKQALLQSVMLVAEDVTVVEALKKTAQRGDAITSIIQSLSRYNPEDIGDYQNTASMMFQNIQRDLWSFDQDQGCQENVFRLLHTIKGNSQLYKFTRMAAMVHRTESDYARCRTEAKEEGGASVEKKLIFAGALHAVFAEFSLQTFIARKIYKIPNPSLAEQITRTQTLLTVLDAFASGKPNPAQELSERARKRLAFDLRLGCFERGPSELLRTLEDLALDQEKTNIHGAVQSAQTQLLADSQLSKTSVSGIQQACQELILEWSQQAEYPDRSADISRFYDSLLTLALQTVEGSVGEDGEQLCLDLYRDSVLAAQPYQASRILECLSHIKQKTWTKEQQEEVLTLIKATVLQVACEIQGTIKSKTRKKVIAAMNMTSLEARSSILNELAGGHGAGLFLLGVVNHEKHPAMNSLLASLGYANFDEFWTQLLAPDIESDYWIESLLEGRDPGHDLIRSHLKALESAPASACLLTSITSSFKSNMTTEAAAESANQTLDIRASEWETIKKGLAELADSVQGANHASLKQLAKAAERATHKSMKEMCLKLGEMVEDFSRGLSKKVRYQVHGEDLYLAPAVLNTVRDVLVHLLRNSLDHGIESEDERRKLGKNPKASLEIVCNEKDGLFEIKVIDDGKGIDGEKVLKKAVSMGQVSAEKAQTMSSMDKINLIFMANLSTKESVSGISGRGVGMDAVKMMVEGKLQGQIRIDTESNKGTVMTLLIPEGSSNLRDLSQAQAS